MKHRTRKAIARLLKRLRPRPRNKRTGSHLPAEFWRKLGAI